MSLVKIVAVILAAIGVVLIIRWLRKNSFRLFRGQRGFTLIETLLAVLILSFIGVAFLSGLTTTSKSTALYQQRVTALNLAQSQMERIKASSYSGDNGTYPVSVTVPSGYQITISTTSPVAGEQMVTVSVNMSGHHLFDLKSIKAKWE